MVTGIYFMLWFNLVFSFVLYSFSYWNKRKHQIVLTADLNHSVYTHCSVQNTSVLSGISQNILKVSLSVLNNFVETLLKICVWNVEKDSIFKILRKTHFLLQIAQVSLVIIVKKAIFVTKGSRSSIAPLVLPH